MARRHIFGGKEDTPQLQRTPNCYYHKHPIAYFCTKKTCTLPLCQECLAIHKKQHINAKEIADQGIVQFQKARNQALIAFSQRQKQILEIQKVFRGKISDLKTQMLKVIDKVFDSICQEALVTDGNLQILAEINQRSSQIKRGSLKELIKYYEDIYGAQHYRKLYKMYTGEYLGNFKYQMNSQQLQKLCRDSIKNLNGAQKENRIENIINEYNVSEPKKTVKIQKNLEQNIQKHHPSSDRNPHINTQPSQQKIQKNNPSILQQRFPVASPVHSDYNEHQQSKVHQYKGMHSQEGFQQNFSNIYTQGRQPQQPSLNYNDSSKPKSVNKRKGLSLTKAIQNPHSLPINTKNSFKPSGQRLELDTHKPTRSIRQSGQTQNSYQSNARKNWRNFVNMGQPQPSKSIPQNGPLNPKQMRDMIHKQKVHQKQLHSVRSAQYLQVPQ